MKEYKPQREYKVGMKLYFPYHNGFIEYEITKMERNWYEDNDGDEVYYNCLYLKPTNPDNIDSICEDYNADELMYVETDRDVIYWKESAYHSDRDEIIEKAAKWIEERLIKEQTYAGTSLARTIAKEFRKAMQQ